MIESLPANMLIFTVNMHIYTYICLKYVWYVRDCHTYQIYILHGSSWYNIICKQIDLYIFIQYLYKHTLRGFLHLHIHAFQKKPWAKHPTFAWCFFRLQVLRTLVNPSSNGLGPSGKTLLAHRSVKKTTRQRHHRFSTEAWQLMKEMHRNSIELCNKDQQLWI